MRNSYERRNLMESREIANSMEILETKPLNDLVTEAIIKVCYVSKISVWDI